MLRTLVRRGVAAAILVVLVTSLAAAADPGSVLAGKGLRPVGAVFAHTSEDDVFKAVADVEAKLKEYRGEKNAKQSDAEKKAMVEELSAQRDALRQQMTQALPQFRRQIQALTMQMAALNQQQASGGFGNGGRGSIPLSSVQTAYQMQSLGQQIAQLEAQSEQMNAAFNDLNNQISELTPKNASNRAKAKPSEKPPASAVDEKRKALTDAIAEARKAVEGTRKEYANLAEDSQVKSALDALNRSASIKQTLGPSRKMLESVRALDRAEAYAVNGEEPYGSRKPHAIHKRKSRSARKK